jgi:hypothetical protein
MTTEKQIKANKENAKLGGVKSEEGKAISKYNAIKHGILGNLISQYDKDINLESLIAKLKEELHPKDLIQEMLVERIGLNYLRMVRALKIEKNLIESIVNPPALEKVYKNTEEKEKYLKAKKSRFDFLTSFGEIPDEPEHEIILRKGEKQEFQEEQIRYLVECIDRYYVNAENRFYRAINMFWEVKGRK